MKLAPVPSDEADRLQALRELLVLDTPPEERFDRIVRFAAEEFGVPVAAIALVDGERLWFKARTGVDYDAVPRATSFCAHAVLGTVPMVVEDMRADERFADNPHVNGTPFARFYAGAPLVLPSGLVVGTLCLLGSRRRQFDERDVAILGGLRDMAVAELVRAPASAG